MTQQMKKIIIIVSSVLGVIIVLLILSFTLFAVKIENVSMHALNETTKFNNEEIKTQIISEAELPSNSSVLFLNKSKIKNRLEKKFPYINIINIETVFPNHLILHFAEREAVFALEYGDNYIIADEDFKVLNIVEETIYNSTNENPILLNGITILNTSITEGDFLVFNDLKIFSNFSKILVLCNRDIVEQRALFKSIELKSDETIKFLTGEAIYLEITDFNDFKINIYAPSNQLSYKIQCLLTSMSSSVPLYIYNYYLEIIEDDGKIFGKLTGKES